jgi:hypothetical protein
MIKEVKYGGYTAQPSDYISQDGDLSLSLNLIQENGSLKPIYSPKVEDELNEELDIKFIHHLSDGTINYIYYRQSNALLCWRKEGASVSYTPLVKTSQPKVSAIGNTLLLLDDNGALTYVLWKDDGYTVLGGKPPFVTIEFGLMPQGEITDVFEEKYQNIDNTCVTGLFGSEESQEKIKVKSGYSKSMKEGLAEITQSVYGHILQQVADNVTSKGYFYQPFFVRYAMKLYDGSSYILHSAPILQLPTTTVPYVQIIDNHKSDPLYWIKCLQIIPYFKLMYKVLDGTDDLVKWQDIVSSIDIFISSPLYTYDQSKDIEGVTYLQNLYFDGLYDYDKENSVELTDEQKADCDYLMGHYYNDNDSAYEDIYYKTVDGTRRTISKDKDYTVTDKSPAWDIPINSDFYNKMRSTCNFYKIASIDVKELINSKSEFEELKLTQENLTSLETLPTLPDDYQTHCKLSAKSIFPFNSRLNLANVTLKLPSPYPLRSVMSATTTVLSGYSVAVYTRKNGVVYKSTSSFFGVQGVVLHGQATKPVNFPRYLFYPDADAFLIEIKSKDVSGAEVTTRLTLTPHDFLNGAYWFGGLGAIARMEQASEISTANGDNVTYRNKVYTSEVDNPFYFPIEGINTVGTGEIIAISSAVRALSQGQFGQHPLYAFTDEGIWALATNEKGTYSAVQPISRDVCLSADSLTQIDTGVLFASQRGIMNVSGSDVECISDALEVDQDFDLKNLLFANNTDFLKTMFESVGLYVKNEGDDDETIVNVGDSIYIENTCITNFKGYIQGCRMIYDYANQRIIVYNTNYWYAYVYSIKSSSWGMMINNFLYSVNSYPDAMAVTRSIYRATDTDKYYYKYSLVDVSAVSPSENATRGLMVTRPLKLDAPDVLKRVTAIIQRGKFATGHVMPILWGSRDLINWRIIGSSNNQYLRYMGGTPYKYFRIALICDLKQEEGESVYGCSINYKTTMTNQLR